MPLVSVPTLEPFRIVMPDGSSRVAGKTVDLNGTLVFFRDFRTAELRKWRAFSLDVRLPPILLDRGVQYVDEVHEGNLHRIGLARYIAIGLRQTHNRLEGEQLYAPAEMWQHLGPLPYRPTFVTSETLVPWVGVEWEPLTVPEPPSPPPQMGLNL